MKIAAVIYAGSLSQRALAPIDGKASAYERCLDFVGGLPGLERTLVVEGLVALPEGACPKVRRELWTLDLLLEQMAEAGQGMDAVLLAWGDEPFLDEALARKMLEDFRRYRAEYGFADGYPLGLAAEILSPRVIPAIRKLAAAIPTALGRDSLFNAIQKDINAFDIETDISPLDLRDMRLTLACDSKRNSLLVERLAIAGVCDVPSALRVLPANLGLLRTLPSFVMVQVAAGCPQACTLCPYPVFGGNPLAKKGEMHRGNFAALLDQVVELSGDAVIDISLWGEPSLHSDIYGLIDEVLARPSLSLIVETSGIGWRNFASCAAALGPGVSERVDWVLSLDAWSPALYAELRGEGYTEALQFAKQLIELYPKRAHVQMLRSKDNEAELEDFWRGWKKKTDNVIVQKYARFASLLPERKVSDLSPLVRRPCWHLKRDLSILLDGNIPLCRDYSQGDITLGNAFDAFGGVSAAWTAGESFHAAYIEACRSGDGSLFPSPCEACDEYYTYNA